MKTKTLFATLLTLAFFTAGYAQTLDKAKLDQFFDRLAEKNKAMGSLIIAKDGNVLYTRAIGYSQIYHRPFQIPALESIAVSPEILDKYVGVYSSPDAPANATVTRDGSTLFFQPPGASSAVPLEATAEDKFQIEGAAVFTFD